MGGSSSHIKAVEKGSGSQGSAERVGRAVSVQLATSTADLPCSGAKFKVERFLTASTPVRRGPSPRGRQKPLRGATPSRRKHDVNPAESHSARGPAAGGFCGAMSAARYRLARHPAACTQGPVAARTPSPAFALLHLSLFASARPGQLGTPWGLQCTSNPAGEKLHARTARAQGGQGWPSSAPLAPAPGEQITHR
jgi:hypothetical protein